MTPVVVVMGDVARLILRPVMRIWGVEARRRLSSAPVPIDDPRTHAPGVDCDRVLIVGSGAAVGWGCSATIWRCPDVWRER